MIYLIILLIIGIVIFFSYRRKKYIEYIKSNSVTLKKLLDLNNKYRFYKITANAKRTQDYDNKIYYDSISCEDYLIYQLQFEQYVVLKEMNYVAINKREYVKYCEEIKSIKNLGEFENFNNRLNKKYLLRLEELLFEEGLLVPQLSFSISVVLYLTTLKGEKITAKWASFEEGQIRELIKKLNYKRGNFYNDRGIWDAICRVERGKVSNKMRFAIYERDGYRCKICGRTDREVNLEIDHIKPIAKGGKSTYDNLQTLCVYCNKEKGDKY